MDATISFDSTASRPKHAVAMVYDLEGFSRFFNQPDVQEYVPKFINKVSAAVNACIFGGNQFWQAEPVILGPLLAPVHEKFLGDGALYVWTNDEGAIDTDFVSYLCNRLFNLKNQFHELAAAAYDELPVVDLPQRIRFGIARGTVYELRRRGTKQREYIGFCINLASRLQKYCPELGFVASARVGLPNKILKEHGYTRVVAKAIKGFPREIVFVDVDEFESLPPKVREEYFDRLPAGSDS
jgi:class 3 adenylate cyclase